MAKQSDKKNGKYLYAVIDNRDALDFASSGIDGGDVYTISNNDGLRIVLSDVVSKKMRPERRYIAAHQKVLEKLMEKTTPLPVVFGTIAKDSKQVQKFLSDNRTVFHKNLRRVTNKVEMGLRCIWNVPNIFEYLVRTNSELIEARNEFFRGSHEPSMDDKIELGKQFSHLLDEEREKHTEKVEAVLLKYCSEIKRNKPFAERDIMNLACLIEKDTQESFEKGIFEAANMFDNNFTFDYNGPWAPHNFVEVDLKFQ